MAPNIMKIFDTSWEQPDSFLPTRHGMPWTESDYHSLYFQFKSGACLQAICSLLKRSKSGVLPKLIHMKLIYRDSDNGTYYHAESKTPTPTPTPESKTMETIETKTFICGVEASTLTDSEIFTKIGKMEAEIKRWDSIENKPKKLGAMIEKMNKEVEELVAYVDAR